MISKIGSIQQKKTSSRVAINTFIIYTQKFSSAAIALVTTPLLLRVLGVEDFGVYVLTTGFVGMVSFFSWSISSASQRFIALALGEKNTEKLNKVISSSVFIHIMYGIAIFILIQVCNFFLIEHFLKIPPSRTGTIRTILSLIAGISFFSIISIPFIGLLRAYENFFALAAVGLTESLLKLLVAFCLLFLGTDKLMLFTVLMFAISIVSFTLYCIITHKHYFAFSFSILTPHFDIVKKMFSFIGWTLLGALAIMSRNQGVSVIINKFFGVVINAAYGIALQVNYALNILAQGVTGSLTPVLLKSAGEKNYDKMLYSMKTMSRMAFFSISIFSIPLLFQMDTVLKLWLGTVPPRAAIFGKLTIVLVLVCILSSGMQAIFDAIGKVKTYNILVSVLLILNLPLAWLFFSWGYPDYTIVCIGILLELASFFVRLWLLKQYLEFSAFEYLKETLLQILVPVAANSVLLYAISLLQLPPMANLFVSFIASILFFSFLVYRFALDRQQKEFVNKFITSLKQRLSKKKG